MERLYTLAGSVRSLLFTCQRNNTAAAADPLVRTALAETVQNDRNEWQDDFQSITSELERVTIALAECMEREQFLDTRIRKYRKALAERSKALAETPHEPNYDARRKVLDHDSETLRGVQVTHKDILIQCETMRRKIKELEQKRDEMARMDSRLHSFVVNSNVQSSRDDEETRPTNENLAPVANMDESLDAGDEEEESSIPHDLHANLEENQR